MLNKLIIVSLQLNNLTSCSLYIIEIIAIAIYFNFYILKVLMFNGQNMFILYMYVLHNIHIACINLAFTRTIVPRNSLVLVPKAVAEKPHLHFRFFRFLGNL